MESEKMSATNCTIRSQISSAYKMIVDQVDPSCVLDLLIQEGVISIERKQDLMSKVGHTKRDQCRELLDHLLLRGCDESLVVFRESLLVNNYKWIVQRIDSVKVEETVVDCNRTGTPANSVRVMVPRLEGFGEQAETQDSELHIGDKTATEREVLLTKELDSAKKPLIRSTSNESVLKSEFEKNINVTPDLQFYKQKVDELERRLVEANELEKHLRQRILYLENRLKTSAVAGNVSLDSIYVNLPVEVCNASEESLEADSEVTTTALPPLPPPREVNTHDDLNDEESARPTPPPRRRPNTNVERNVNEPDDNDESALLTKPVLSGVIKGDGAVRGVAMLDNQLYVIRFGSNLVEVYDANDGFKRSRKSIVITPPRETAKTGFLNKLKAASKPVPVSFDFQDIASCNLTKRLYLCDSQTCAVMCVDPRKREVDLSWRVEDEDPFRISVTFESNIVVSCEGALYVYSNRGLLIQKIVLDMVDDGPWHGIQMDVDCWVICHGLKYLRPDCFCNGFITATHSDGTRHEDYPELEFNTAPAHLALLPNGKLLAVESDCYCVFLVGRLFRGEVREILNLDHCTGMPVRIHYCRDSGRLMVGHIDGTVVIYRIMAS